MPPKREREKRLAGVFIQYLPFTAAPPFLDNRYLFAFNHITGVGARATVRVVVLTPDCNEVGKHVWRRARATVPALGLHRTIPGPRRANTNSCSRSPLYSRDGCVCSAVLTRVRVRHPLRTHESN